MWTGWSDPSITIEILNQNAVLPSRRSSGRTGLDVLAPRQFTIPSESVVSVPLGFKCLFPRDWMLLVFGHSNDESVIGISKTAEIIDPDNNNEIVVHLFNAGLRPAEFNRGDKIAQLVLVPMWPGNPQIGIVPAKPPLRSKIDPIN